MSDIIRRHISQYPNARTSTVVYLQKREEMTERLRQELGMQKSRKPWWKRVLDRIGGRDGAH
jgi:hypothetical protein